MDSGAKQAQIYASFTIIICFLQQVTLSMGFFIYIKADVHSFIQQYLCSAHCVPETRF